jgi:DNA-binding response OmpR family regulator
MFSIRNGQLLWVFFWLVARRSNTQSDVASSNENQIQFGQFHIDVNSRTTKLHGQLVAVSSNEFDVHWHLAQSAGQLVK